MADTFFGEKVFGVSFKSMPGLREDCPGEEVGKSDSEILKRLKEN